MNEAIDQSRADQSGKRRLIVAIAGGHQHQVGKLTLDLFDKDPRALMQGLHVEHDDADFPATRRSLTLSAEGTCHRRLCAAHRFAQRLQEGIVRGQHHEFDDVAREAELQRVQCAAVLVRS